MPAPLMPRQEVVNRLFQAFRTYGYEGATLARLSEATGLGRASLYHYFPDGKEGMVREVLDTARAWIQENVIKPLSNDSAPLPNRVKTAMRNITAGYEAGAASCLVNVFGVGDAASMVRDDLRATAQLYAQGFTRLLTDAGVGAAKARELGLDTVLQIEGSLVMARALDDRNVFVRRMEKLEKQYLELIR